MHNVLLCAGTQFAQYSTQVQDESSQPGPNTYLLPKAICSQTSYSTVAPLRKEDLTPARYLFLEHWNFPQEEDGKENE